jgi:UDP-glucose 4-epimerase
MARDITLVTGGAGYVGSHTVATLVAAGQRVAVLDNLSSGHRASVPEGVELLEIDLADAAAVDAALARLEPRAVLHFAARSLVPESMREPMLYLGGNVVQASNLLSAALRHGVERFVLSSTASVYGEPTTTPIDEDHPLVPNNPYGESKVVIERMLAWLETTRGLRWATLRYFNAAGAALDGHNGEDHRPETHLVPLVLQVAAGSRDALAIYGDDYHTPDGSCVRDYVHVLDLAEAHVLALDALDRHASLTINLGSESGHSVMQVLDSARRITGHPIPSRIEARRPGDAPTLVASCARARDLLGWQPRHSQLDTIIETAWRWHRDHPLGFG